MKQFSCVKLCYVVFFFLFLVSYGYGQIILFDFGGEPNASPATLDSDFNDDALMLSTVSRGAGVTASNELNGFAATGWVTTSIADAVVNDDYFEFSVTPKTGFEFSVTTIEINMGRSDNGFTEIALRSSLDGYSTNIDGVKPVVDVAGIPDQYVFNVSQPNNVISITYRLYGYSEGASGENRLKQEGIIVNGTVASTTPIPCVVSDDFTGPSLGGQWTDVVGGNSTIVSDQLSIGTGGILNFDYLYQDVGSLYNTALSTLSNSITWEFNMRQSRFNPSGFNYNRYGVAFVLGGTHSDIENLGNGYAVVLGQSGDTDYVRLVSYVDGLHLDSGLTDIITGSVDYGNEYLSIRVTYDPATDSWELFVRNDGILFSNPVSLDASDSVGTALDSTYVDSTLNYISAVFNHATEIDETATFDSLCISTSMTCSSPTSVWNGSSWNNIPDLTTPVILNGSYNTFNEGSFSACSLTVNSGTLTVAEGYHVEVQNDVVANGDIVVNPRGAFVQISNISSVSGSGTISVEQETASANNWYEYTYWSSPVVNANIANGLTDSQSGRRFLFYGQNFLDATAEMDNDNTAVLGQDNIDDNGDAWALVGDSHVMTSGVGYASTHNRVIFESSLGFPKKFVYSFNGLFNNGQISVPLYRNDSEMNDINWNFIGNPYASAINADIFLSTNSEIDGAIYLWSQNTPPSTSANGNQVSNFSNSDYAVINSMGETAGGDAEIPSRFIPSCQGFFVSYSDAATPVSTSGDISQGTATFNNAMRVKGTTENSLFFKNANTKDKELVSSKDDNKIWLNLTSDNGVFSQVLIGYTDKATNADDGAKFDALKFITGNEFAVIYSRIKKSNKKYVIQGRNSKDLTRNDKVELGFQTAIKVPTLFKFSLDKVQGNFMKNNSIFIKDNLLKKTHDLSNSDYTFTSEVGEFNDRFEISFKGNSSVNNRVVTNKVTVVERNNDKVVFSTAADFNIELISIYDFSGNLIYKLEGNSAQETFELSKLKKSLYIAKVELTSGEIITKKFIKK